MVGSDSGARPRPFGLHGALGSFRPLDLLVAGYTTVSGLALLFGAFRGAPGCGPQVFVDVAILAGLAVVVLLSADTRSRVLTLVRLAFGPVLLWVFYNQIDVIWPVFRAEPLDGLLAAAERALFGLQPSLDFRAAAPYPWLSEIFCVAYFAYYFYPLAVLAALLVRRGYLATERTAFATAACFLFCYTIFWIFPTVAPHFWFPPRSGPQLYDGRVFNHLLFFLTSRGEIRGGAFPSSHIAVAVLLTLAAHRDVRWLFWVLLPVTLLLCPAVVYLRAHYALDVPAGVVVGLFFARYSDRLASAMTLSRRPG